VLRCKSSYAIGGKGKERAFTKLVNAIWDQRQKSLILLYEFLRDFCEWKFIFNKQFSLFLVKAITYNMSGSADT
jgi:hypothetical protein